MRRCIHHRNRSDAGRRALGEILKDLAAEAILGAISDAQVEHVDALSWATCVRVRSMGKNTWVP